SGGSPSFWSRTHGCSRARASPSLAPFLASLALAPGPLPWPLLCRGRPSSPLGRPRAGGAAGALAVPLPWLRPFRAGREPLRADPPRDAPARRLGHPPPAGRALPRQAAPVLLAGDEQLPGSGRECLGGAHGPRPGGSPDPAAVLPDGPALDRRAVRLPRSPS